MDALTKLQRSALMSNVRSKDTTTELAVRGMIFSLGFRYRLHRVDLPGKPDLVFVSKRKIIFINGCFWHRHKGCKYSTTPKSNKIFWLEKFEKNIRRDKSNRIELRSLGWKILTVWQCELKKRDKLERRIIDFLCE